MTVLTDTLLAAVHADPTDRDRWRILADAYADVGDELEERFWRFALRCGVTPYEFFSGGWGRNQTGGIKASVWNMLPRREAGDTVQRCFERLRIGWELAGRPL